MNESRLIIDGAFSEPEERIGYYLTQSGQEDASGARRFYMDMLREGKFDKVAYWLKVDANTIRKEFGYLQESK